MMDSAILSKRFTPEVIRIWIKHYCEPSGYKFNQFDNIISLYADFHNAINNLCSPREIEVINTVINNGFENTPSIIGISIHTVAFHLVRASKKISRYLNGDD